MSFELHLSIPEGSRQWRAIQRVASEQNVTPEVAAEQLFEVGVRTVADNQKSRRSPDLTVAATQPIFGIFAETRAFGDSIEEIISGRRERYTKE